MILNLPTTVEAFPPNVYADRLEWFQRHVSARDHFILSVHPHNDRGTAVATAELGLMAGAERVEGTLFGNGERTGNVDLITLALNLFTPGSIRASTCPTSMRPNASLRSATSCRCTRATRGPASSSTRRSPARIRTRSRRGCTPRSAPSRASGTCRIWPSTRWTSGRTYEAIIRVNSQSGKGGVAYLMETEHHLELPRGLQVDFAQQVQAITDARGDELSADELLAAFHDHYLAHTRPYELVSYSLASAEDEDRIVAKMLVAGEPQEIEGVGNGPIAALVDAFERQFGVSISLRDYHEHAMAASATATAAAYVEADVDDDSVWGVGLHPSIVTASLRAVVNAVNRAIAAREALAAASAAFESR